MTAKDRIDLTAHLDNLERSLELLGAQVAHLRHRMESIALEDGATPQLRLPIRELKTDGHKKGKRS